MLRRFSRINSVPHYRVENTGVAQYAIKSTEDTATAAAAAATAHAEYQYLNLIHDIIQQNNEQTGRNGSTYSIFGAGMVFSLDQGTIPILTTKKMAWKTCLKELLWFVQGKTDNRILQDAGVHIWDDNASPDFMESRGLAHYAEGDLGPIYGHQWRHFNAAYENHETDYTGRAASLCLPGIRANWTRWPCHRATSYVSLMLITIIAFRVLCINAVVMWV
jgi:hypothetical protein